MIQSLVLMSFVQDAATWVPNESFVITIRASAAIILRNTLAAIVVIDP